MPETISNPDGTDFDFADPEFWEYYGVESCTALEIAEGFTDYWLDVAGWYVPEAPYSIAERVAARRRQSNLGSLANESIPGTRFKIQQSNNTDTEANRW